MTTRYIRIAFSTLASPRPNWSLSNMLPIALERPACGSGSLRSATSSRSKRVEGVILLCGGVFLALSVVVFIWFLDPILQHLYGGVLYAHLVGVRRHHGPMDRDAFLIEGRLQFSRLCLLVLGLNCAVAAWVARGTVRRRLTDFFTTPASPVNLALFRIAVFGVILYFFCTDFANTLRFAGLPKVLQDAPYGTGWLLPHLPINSHLVFIASILFLILCVLGLLGIRARIIAMLTALVGFYVLGVTQFYGKVSHDHEYIWFLVLLAVSPCADTLAIDAIFAARTRADVGTTEPPADSLAYALPLRFASVLIGFIYFFPGFWKFWYCGFSWALSDNMKYQMYSKWMEFPGWLPLFRLDLHPWLYRSVGFATLVIEMSFVFLIFFPWLRRIAPLGAASFHIGSYFFLRIFFYSLIVFYIALFDMAGVFRKLGTWLFKSQLIVFYDDDCSFCRRAIAAIRTLDVLGAIRYASARQNAELHLGKHPTVAAADLLEDMHSVCEERKFVGMATYRQIAVRIPFFWPLVPFLYIVIVFRLGEILYERTKHARVCEIPSGNRAPARKPWIMGMAATGVVLLLGSFYTGARGITAGWPFACFPTFADLAQSHISVLQINAFDVHGHLLPTDSPSREVFGDQRLRGLLNKILNNPGDNHERLYAVWQLYRQMAPELRSAGAIRFYRASVSTIPGDSSISGRNQIAEMDATGSWTALGPIRQQWDSFLFDSAEIPWDRGHLGGQVTEAVASFQSRTMN